MNRRALVAALVGAGACATPSEELAPYGEALVVVDTDLPVPQIANRLRIDLYADDGTWFESRDVARYDPRDWPASFSVYSGDDGRAKDVMVRLRAYPEGTGREYLGERFAARPSMYRPPAAARTLDEACANAPLLPMGERLTLRIGSDKLTDHGVSPRCKTPTGAGAAIARIAIEAAGIYRFDVASSVPYEAYAALSLRRVCTDVATQLACDAELGTAPFSTAHFPRFDVRLDPGTYFLVADGLNARWPLDVVLEAAPVDTPLPPRAGSPAPAPPNLPRLLVGASDVTPKSEPLPTASVDRLLRVHLEPGRRGRVSVTLRTACAGTMARLGADPSQPDPRTATTCVDREGERVAVETSPLDNDLFRGEPTAQGAVAQGQACDGIVTDPGRACIPGGTFLLGSHLISPATATISDAAPERIAVMSRFYLDRDEVTVGRFRAAGLAYDATTLGINDAPIGAPSEIAPDKPFPFERFCTFSRAPMAREHYPLSCVSWELARAFCLAAGGDLPTEAQWEYAATAAGRSFKTLYPWGDDSPSCERAVFANLPESFGPGCSGTTPTIGVTPVENARGVRGGDVTPDGVGAMAGNLSELVLDAADGYDGECWKTTSLTDPRCLDPSAPRRVMRGASWIVGYLHPPSVRQFLPPFAPVDGRVPAGFRCAYGAPR